MVDLYQLIDYLDDELEVSTIDDFCPNGLQVEGQNKTVQLIATAVSASLETIHKATLLKPQVLLVHHGLFWDKDSHRILGVKKEKIMKLLQHGITLLGYHLPLDCHKVWGNNWKAARDMGWKDLKSFGSYCGSAQIGVIGNMDSIPIATFQKQLEKYYQHPAHIALGGPTVIKKAALISGGAHKEIRKAIETKADAFITGSFDEPIWHIAHEEKINFFALGHSHTERVGPQAIGDHLAKKFNLKHQFIDIENPF